MRRIPPVPTLALVSLLAGCAQRSEWHSLFDGTSLAGWQRAEFVDGGQPRVEDGKLILPASQAGLTGARREAAFAPGNYEVQLEAMRVEGHDFFCGITFPVAGSFASLILGGWGGMVCGISSLEGMDAANNETTRAKEFETGTWYRVRLRVTDEGIEAWVDEEKIVGVATEGRKIGVRRDIDASKPFGLSSWRTTAALRDIRWRAVSPEAAGD